MLDTQPRQAFGSRRAVLTRRLADTRDVSFDTSLKNFEPRFCGNNQQLVRLNSVTAVAPSSPQPRHGGNDHREGRAAPFLGTRGLSV